MTYWERLLAEYVGGGDSPISPTLIAKSITTNGTYNAVDDEVDGYSSVSVNVPNTSTLKGNLPLTFKTSEEQLRDWTIYGDNTQHTYSATGTLPLTVTTHTAGAASDWVIEGNNNIGKNIFQIIPSEQVITETGTIHFSSDAVNGVISVSGTGTGSESSIKQSFTVTQEMAGNYYYSADFSTKGSSTTYDLYLWDNTINHRIYMWDGVTNSPTIKGTEYQECLLIEGHSIEVSMRIRANVSTENLTFRPMIRPADTSATFEPYQIGVGEPTKNLLEITAETQTLRGVTFTIDKQAGTMTMDGDTIQQTAGFSFEVMSSYDLDGTFILSGGADGGSVSKYALYMYDAYDQRFSDRLYNSSAECSFTCVSGHKTTVFVQVRKNNIYSNIVFKPMLRASDTTPTSFIPYGYCVPLTVSQTGQTDKNYEIFVGDSPLTEGQSISKTSTGVDIAAMAGSNTITTDLYNQPSMSIEGVDYVGVGEPTNDGWQIPLTVSDGTNTTTVNVPIDAPLTSTDSVSNAVTIPTYVGTNTIDTTLVEPVTADIVYVGVNSTLINKTVNQNGTYFAYSDNANGYNSVAVAVPNTYTNEDESKVVSNGELVAQTTASVTTNGIVDTTTISSVSVDVPTAGSTTGDVRFLDYDGTVVQAYSKSEFASLTALPANPAHEGLTAQGWNWSLEDAKTYVAAYDKLDIGQMYITNDGKTRLYVTLDNGRLNPTLAIAVNGSCDVDWGDGTTHDTLTGTSLNSRVAASHTYATGGDYVIALTVTGSFAIVGGSNGSLLFTYNNTGNDNRSKGYRNILRGVEIGDGITTIDRYAFANCLALSSITIPDSVASIEDNVFNTCIALSSITIPDDVASVAAYVFDSCYSLSSVTIPKSVTLIGGDAFRYCYTLSSVTIPSSVTRIGVDVFRYCYALSSVTIPNSVTEIGSYAFDSCYSLSSVIIPNSVTTIDGSAFSLCRTLVNVTIPNSITSISAYTFSGCATLPSITIPASVTSIGGNAFASCGSLSSIVFQSETPPEIASSSAFYNVPDDCIIYVPTGTLADYTSASNYPSSSTYTYVEY